MTRETLEIVKPKVVELCTIRGCNNRETLTNCFQIIDQYLAYEGSSVATLLQCLEFAINNKSWIVAWTMIAEETAKLSGKYASDLEKAKKESERILLDYEPLDLGERIFDITELQNLKIRLGVIDAFGTFHTSERSGVIFSKWPDHRDLANYLHLQGKIMQYYIRVGCLGVNDGLLSAESLSYGNMESLKKFLLTEKMAIALYNSIMSKVDVRFSSFEEKLAYYGTEFGYCSTMYQVSPQIYDKELFYKNMQVLERALGERFNLKYFNDVLKR